MKLAVSNIAWTNEEEKDMAECLQKLGVHYVEVAPTKLWEDPTKAHASTLEDYKKFWKKYDIDIVAFQSMLFNRPDLKIFESDELYKETLTYLQDFIKVAPELGAKIMVFGSPKNRQRGEFDRDKALKLAVPFFRSLGETARANRVCFCIEPNPQAYNCDFVTTTTEGIDLVNRVDSPGFGLHLDIAGMTLANESVADSIKTAGSMIKHFHISAPYLEAVKNRGDIDYNSAAKALRSINYQNYVSIEMKPNESGNLDGVEKAVRFAQRVFTS